MKRYPTIVERVAIAIPEKRVELGLSLNQAEPIPARFRGTVARIERRPRVGRPVVVQVAAALLILELHEQPATLEDALATMTRPTEQPSRALLASRSAA